jgi:hypothetical protein
MRASVPIRARLYSWRSSEWDAVAHPRAINAQPDKMKRITNVLIVLLFGCSTPTPDADAPIVESQPASASLPSAFDQTIPGAPVTLHMVPVSSPVPGGEPFFIASTEITWDLYDVYAMRLDDPDSKAADAITRPSKPYLPPDRGWGHAGFPAMCITFKGASEFCAWLSKRTGRRFRLPTDVEWEHAARAGALTAWCCGDEASALGDHAWCSMNSEDMTHPVGKKKPNAIGLYDMHGNVAEWCVTADSKPVTCGGSFRDDPDGLKCAARVPPSKAWQRTDPQEPKSPWWLTDAPFIGFRVVTDASSQ